MKIALLHYTSPPVVGGVEAVLAQHARLMAKAGHQVCILTGSGEQFDPQIPVHILPQLNSRHPDVLRIKADLDNGIFPPAVDRLRDQIKEDLLANMGGIDLLIAHNVASVHINLSLTAALFESYLTPGFPHLILWHHDLAWTALRYRNDLHDGYPWDLLRSRWDGATHVAVSLVRRGELSSLLGIEKESIQVIPNGVELGRFLKLDPQTVSLIDQLDLRKADPLLLLPARLTPRKNIELALCILSELRRICPGAMLVVTGPEGPHNPANAVYKTKLLRQRDELDLRDSVYFLAELTPGFIPDSVISDLYRLADGILVTSQDEGFGLPILEAGVSSTPVFCTDIPALRELGGNDVTYFEPGAEPASIARQISERLNGEMVSRLSRRVKHSFNWDSIYSSHIAPLIEEAAA